MEFCDIYVDLGAKLNPKVGRIKAEEEQSRMMKMPSTVIILTILS